MRLACAYATFLLLRDVILPCILAYLINPVRITFMSLVGFRPRRQPLPQRRCFDEVVPMRQLPRAPKRPSIRLRADRPSSPIALDFDSRSATYRSRASSLTIDTPFGKSHPFKLADDD
ncbi:hypothetical protein niasHT_009698 [Heterodera trifolii]|uniref:Secreted protein n=1 Tax=Heterodera trifolii TaxID=157864 RepID=A0ABD2MDF7_9BILA